MSQYWWVNQRNFEYQRESNCHWSLLRDEAGRTPFHWENITKAKVGDIVFSHADRSLRAVSVVTKEAYVSAYPDELDDPDADKGWRLDVEYKAVLATPIPKVDFVDELVPLLQDFQRPINKHKKANLGYFYALPKAAGEFLMGLIEAQQLEKVVGKRNPPWRREELILALDYYLSHPLVEHSASNPGIIELSEVLNALPFHLDRPDAGRFRNPNDCEMKLCNFRAFDPNYEGKGLDAGSKLDKATWDEFYGRQDVLAKEAAALRNLVDNPETLELVSQPVEDEEGFVEGAIKLRMHRARERNQALVEKAKKTWAKRPGGLRCEVCDFSFTETYGELGEGFIEAHHRKPISELNGPVTAKVEDLAPVCANCHRMLHRAVIRSVETLAEELMTGVTRI